MKTGVKQMKHINTMHKMMEDHASKGAKGFEEAQKFMEEHMASTAVFGEGAQALVQETAEYAMGSFQQMLEASQAIMQAGSVEAAISLQQDYAKYAQESFKAHVTKMTEAFTGLAKDASKPIEKRMKTIQAGLKK